MSEVPRKVRRMDPASRESAILKCAAEIVAKEGISAVTMDRVAQESGVSRSLIYVYFPNTTVLLQELYLRETQALRKRQKEESVLIEGFDDYIRCLTVLYLEHVKEKGNFMTKLMHDPSVTEVVQSNFSRARRIGGIAIAERITKKYDIPLSVSVHVADIGMGLSARAGDHTQRFGLPLAAAADLTIAMILGAIEGAVQSYRRGELKLPDEERLETE